MTDSERHTIIGQVVDDIAETKKNLACLEVKAERMALEFGLLANWLRGHFPSGVSLNDGLSIEDALNLIETIKETKEKLEGLEDRRSQLGV